MMSARSANEDWFELYMWINERKSEIKIVSQNTTESMWMLCAVIDHFVVSNNQRRRVIVLRLQARLRLLVQALEFHYNIRKMDYT